MLGFHMEEISELINDINIITKVNCVLYDKDFHILHNYKESMCKFCSLVRTDDSCRQKCLACDLEGFRHALEQKGRYRYKCHMGLTETVTPIVCDDIIVGFMMVGQNLLLEDLDAVKANIERFSDEETRRALRQALEQMKFTSDAELSAMTNLVQMCASYLHMKKLIQFRETPLSVLLKQYIENHLADELDVKELCREFKMSKSSLYLLARDAFGQGITEYIRARRVERAKDLLTETRASVAEVAERVGYADTNYFTKVFKRYTGKTPSDWRKRFSEQMAEK